MKRAAVQTGYEAKISWR